MRVTSLPLNNTRARMGKGSMLAWLGTSKSNSLQPESTGEPWNCAQPQQQNKSWPDISGCRGPAPPQQWRQLSRTCLTEMLRREMEMSLSVLWAVWMLLLLSSQPGGDWPMSWDTTPTRWCTPQAADEAQEAALADDPVRPTVGCLN